MGNGNKDPNKRTGHLNGSYYSSSLLPAAKIAIEMEAEELPATYPESLVSEPELNNQPKPHQNSQEEEGEVGSGESQLSSFDQKEIVRALEVVERDSVAIAESFTSLFSSLRSALSEVTGSSVNHMHCFSDAAGHLQECALDAATKGNRYINSCLRLNEEMKGIDSLAVQIKILRRNVDALDSNVNRFLRLP